MAGDFAAWAAQAGDGEFWVIAGLLIAAALAAFLFSFHYLRRARLLEDVPTSRVRSAAQGYAELDGIARLLDGPVIVGPLTGVRCVWWEYKIEEKITTGSGKNRQTHWRTLEFRESECLFAVDDDTGTCVIDPDGASVITSLCDRWRGHHPRWTGPPPAAGWRRWFGGRFRYTERRLAPNRPLLALGWFRTEGGAGSDFNTAEEVRLRLAAMKADRADLVRRFDRDGDGEVNLVEWEAARRAAEDEVRAEQAARALRPGVNVLAQPPRHIDRPFLLSALPQQQLTRRFRLAAGALLAGFFAAGGGAAFIIGARLA